MLLSAAVGHLGRNSRSEGGRVLFEVTSRPSSLSLVISSPVSSLPQCFGGVVCHCHRYQETRGDEPQSECVHCSSGIRHHSPSSSTASLSLFYQIHPIFVLSLADLLLAVLWIIGGALWFRSISDRSWCFAVSLLTVVCGPASLREQ